jgi:hypothetical protein
LRDHTRDPAATIRAIEDSVARKDAREWTALLEQYDTCAALLEPLDASAPLELPIAPQLCRDPR